MKPNPLGPSAKVMALAAALALVVCTVVLWGVVARSGKVTRDSAELAARMRLMAPEPRWNDRLNRAALEKSLRAARPDLPGNAQLCFVAPCWAVVHLADSSLLLRWQPEAADFGWTELDRTQR
ncbi:MULTISPECIES: hypothetical protein [unclassified Pyramidobacter]|uniref:hypothetical protein n=1 Tax=unclassified Pyramidobacter TaxID=2632171 RepID=UPI000EA0179F|nr:MULTISPECIES: hypothetical protein [unclassified Pyramidobacter]MCI7404626.1 hypothetical protein [Pyramidobacter sp.]MDY3213063.1 hypothetical protein [Pyramidobacter sp.]RKJ79238.1 hypothetical protein D7D26_05280 [Pyramidobacter sp. CG50-2]WOL40467.1 hypothetical protein RAH42_02230 [Pyramidobacter sp. YE332]